MGLFDSLQAVDGEKLFARFAEGLPEHDMPEEDIDRQTRYHLSRIEQFPPLFTYVREFGLWAMQQAERGQIDEHDAKMLTMGAMGTAAALASYAMRDQSGDQ